jgi:ubiquinone/menaquinone biosynthesis C-methylase UbiE
MLAAAAAREAGAGIRWIRASAEALPLRPASADLVFLYLVYHHLVDRPAALGECARVLAPGGAVVIVNATVETLDAHVWLPFFPSARAVDLARLPSRAGLAAAAAAAGLAAQHRLTAANPVAPDLRTYARRVAARAISTLQLVPDDEFARGVEAFARFCERQDRGAPVEDPIDVFVLRR